MHRIVILPMIMSASIMVERSHHAGGFVYGVFWADGANMVGAAV